MTENFQDEIKGKIDRAFEKVKKSPEFQKLEDLNKKCDQLRYSLKISFSNEIKNKELYSESAEREEDFFPEDWESIYQSIPKDLLKEFSIENADQLAIFVLGKEKQDILRTLVKYEYNTLTGTEFEMAGKKQALTEIKYDFALKDIDKVKPEWIEAIVIENLATFKRDFRANLANIDGTTVFEKKIIAFGKTSSEFKEKREHAIVNAQAVIARNLYFQDEEVNEPNVKKEVDRILKVRDSYKGVNLFEGRSVVLAAHGERKEKDDFGDLSRFGRQALVNRIKAEGGSIKGVLKPYDGFESSKETKRAILKSIKESKPPFTFIFDGHGSPENLYISDGEIKNLKINQTKTTISISVKELFEAYRIRQRNFYEKSNAPSARDIFLLSSCYNSNFIRKFYELCDEEKISKPIFAGESEYGQFGYSNYSSRYGSRFFDAIFVQDKPTLGSLIDNDSRLLDSNPSIYIPKDDNVTMQIAKNESFHPSESQFA